MEFVLIAIAILVVGLVAGIGLLVSAGRRTTRRARTFPSNGTSRSRHRASTCATRSAGPAKKVW